MISGKAGDPSPAKGLDAGVLPGVKIGRYERFP